MSLYMVNVTIHVFAAVIWLGGMFFFALVGAPVLRKVEPEALRASLFRNLGEQFRVVGWVAIAVLLITGTLNLYLRGMFTDAVLGSSAFWATRYGHTLGVKLVAVALMLIIQAVHDFHLGPAATRAVPGSPEAVRMRGHAALLARLSAIAGLILLVAAVRLTRGG